MNTASSSMTTAKRANIVETAVAAGQFKTLAAALEAAGLESRGTTSEYHLSSASCEQATHMPSRSPTSDE